MSSSLLAAAYESLLEEVRGLDTKWWNANREIFEHTFRFAGKGIVFRKTGYSGPDYDPEHIGYSISFGAIRPGDTLTIWVHKPQKTNTDANQRAVLAAIQELARSPHKLTTTEKAIDYL